MRLTLPRRVMDFLVAVALLVLAAPAMMLIAGCICVAMGRPVLFRQVRAGYRGNPFTLVKFRTMREAFGRDGQPLSDAERLTGLGRLLRRTSLDELPQLFNVLRGQLSLVGPRPLLMRYLDRYTPEQARRHEVTPGLTGWTQVNGRNRLSWEEKFALDVWYVDHQSPRLDAWILLLTVWQVLRREGISHDGDATMPEFMGSTDKPPHLPASESPGSSRREPAPAPDRPQHQPRKPNRTQTAAKP
ncbi:MAG: sugar transferase [Pirellulales bacterium]|nr:sugar transferase [Pirellulales bacterium]